MRQNRVKQLWKENKPVALGWCGVVEPMITEAMARAGFDALLLDMQHGIGIGPERMVQWLQIVAQTDCTPIVRVPWNEPAYAQMAMDSGALGIITPMVNNVEEARLAIGACRYPPIGFRSNGANRARFMGTDYFDYFSKANDEVICLVMIETAEAIENIESIADVPGLDGFFIGPSDLAVSMGLPPAADVKDPRHVAAVQKVADVSRAKGLHSAIYATGPEEASRRWKQQGYNMNPMCVDFAQVIQGAGRAVSEFRAETAK